MASMLNMLLQHQSEAPQQNPLLGQTGGTASIQTSPTAPVNSPTKEEALEQIHAAAGLPPPQQYIKYKPGDVTFGERPSSAYETFDDIVSDDNQFHHRASFVKDGDRINAVIHDVGPNDDEQRLLDRPLTRVEAHKLKKGMLGFLQDQVEMETEGSRWNSLTPAQREAEIAKEQLAQKVEEDAHTKEVHGHVDALVASGWRPDVNRHGGWTRPELLRPYASPKSQDKIYARLKDHGIDVDAEARRARERAG